MPTRTDVEHVDCRPKEDRVFHVLHWIKSIFKKDALDRLEEGDCLNKEAFRCVNLRRPGLFG